MCFMWIIRKTAQDKTLIITVKIDIFFYIILFSMHFYTWDVLLRSLLIFKKSVKKFKMWPCSTL